MRCAGSSAKSFHLNPAWRLVERPRAETGDDLFSVAPSATSPLTADGHGPGDTPGGLQRTIGRLILATDFREPLLDHCLRRLVILSRVVQGVDAEEE